MHGQEQGYRRITCEDSPCTMWTNTMPRTILRTGVRGVWCRTRDGSGLYMVLVSRPKPVPDAQLIGGYTIRLLPIDCRGRAWIGRKSRALGSLPGDDDYRVIEGGADLNLDSCIGTWIGAPPGSDYVFAWTTRGGTPKSALSLLSNGRGNRHLLHAVRCPARYNLQVPGDGFGGQCELSFGRGYGDGEGYGSFAHLHR